MPDRLNILLYEGNVEKASLVITKEDDDTPQDITAAFIEVYIKPDRDVADNDGSVVKLSDSTGEVVKTSPLLGQATVTFPDDLPAGTLWWRVDVILSGQRKTACFGTLLIENT